MDILNKVKCPIAHKGKALALIVNVRLGQKRLVSRQQSSLLNVGIIYDCKKIYCAGLKSSLKPSWRARHLINDFDKNLFISFYFISKKKIKSFKT
jgi:hypothetical protein